MGLAVLARSVPRPRRRRRDAAPRRIAAENACWCETQVAGQRIVDAAARRRRAPASRSATGSAPRSRPRPARRHLRRGSGRVATTQATGSPTGSAPCRSGRACHLDRLQALDRRRDAQRRGPLGKLAAGHDRDHARRPARRRRHRSSRMRRMRMRRAHEAAHASAPGTRCRRDSAPCPVRKRWSSLRSSGRPIDRKPSSLHGHASRVGRAAVAITARRCCGSRCSGTGCPRARRGSRLFGRLGIFAQPDLEGDARCRACRSRTAARAPRAAPAADGSSAVPSSPSMVVTA